LVFPGLKIESRELDFFFQEGENFKRHPIIINSEGILRHAEGYDHHGETFKLAHDFFNAAFESGLKEKFLKLYKSIDFDKRLIFVGAGIGGSHARHAALQFGSMRYKYYRELDPNLEREFRYKMAGDHWAVLTFGSIPCMDRAGISHFDKFFPESSSKSLVDVSHEGDPFHYIIAHNIIDAANTFFRKNDSEVGWSVPEGYDSGMAIDSSAMLLATMRTGKSLLEGEKPRDDVRQSVFMYMLDYSKVEEIAYHLMRISREHDKPLAHLKSFPKISRNDWLAGPPRKEVWEYYGLDCSEKPKPAKSASNQVNMVADGERESGDRYEGDGRGVAAASGGASAEYGDRSLSSKKPSRRSRFFASLKRGASAAARGASIAAKVAYEVGKDAFEAYQEYAEQEREREEEFQVRHREFMTKLNAQEKKEAQQRHNHAVAQRKKWNGTIREKKEQLQRIRDEKKSLKYSKKVKEDQIEIDLHMDFGFYNIVELEDARKLVKQKKADRDTWESVKGLEKRVNLRLKPLNDKINQLEHQEKKLSSEVNQLVQRVKESREKEEEQRFY